MENTGDKAGKEVVQVYANAPKGGLDKPAKELRAFAKTRTLNKGEKQTLTMTLPVTDLASYNEQTGKWEVAKGEYTFFFSANVEDTRATAKMNIK